MTRIKPKTVLHGQVAHTRDIDNHRAYLQICLIPVNCLNQATTRPFFLYSTSGHIQNFVKEGVVQPHPLPSPSHTLGSEGPHSCMGMGWPGMHTRTVNNHWVGEGRGPSSRKFWLATYEGGCQALKGGWGRIPIPNFKKWHANTRKKSLDLGMFVTQLRRGKVFESLKRRLNSPK